MPFEARPTAPRNIAIIGAGISGLGAALMLADDHKVTVYEAEPRLGGHARTIMAGKRGDQPVDTGFIVFNRANYPHLCAMFERLEVPVAKSDMSFSASLRGGAMEYGLRDMRAVFAQKSNLAKPKFWGMIRDITRFNAQAAGAAQDPEIPLGAFLDQLNMGDWFRRYYLLPLSGAIWSTPTEKILDFPARALVQFFENHALLHHTGQHQWYTVQGGSVEYVRRLEDALKKQDVAIRLNCPVDAVRREAGSVAIKAKGGEWEHYDEVIFATHSDDSLRMLDDASADEQKALSSVGYQPNSIVLHSDTSIMPKRKAVWSSWNYTETTRKEMNQIDLTYWMNCLQPIPKDDPLFVTLNSTRAIREDLIHDEVTLRHPVYDLAALEGQKLAAQINGTNNTWFCGAWMKNGFHEDGLSSAVDVAEALTARLAQPVRAA